MEPDDRARRQSVMLIGRRSWRVVISVAFALALMSMPVVQVAACSCAMGETDAQIRGARLAFIGTVVDQRPTGARNQIGDSTVEYAFEVERANAPTQPQTVVTAGTSEASCGITFAPGETWLIIIPEASDMGDTHLCAGNLRLADLDPDDLGEIEALLAVVPTPDSAGEASSGISVPLPVLVVALAAGAVAVVGLLAFRRERVS